MSSQPLPSISSLTRAPSWEERLSTITNLFSRKCGSQDLLDVGLEDLTSGGPLYRQRRPHPL